jgi:glycine/D-amino acid oxidase-like deaminating enzyme
VDNVFVNSGHQMLGITLAPISGEALAGMIAGDKSVPEAFQAQAFNPGRF